MIANSNTGAQHAQDDAGFRPKRLAVIPNGIDTRRWFYKADERRALRQRYRVGREEFLVGMVGRIDAMKGHSVFLKAAARAYEAGANLRFLIVGKGCDALESALTSEAKQLGIDHVLIWAGEVTNTVGILSALDVFVSSSSYGEGFPNVIGEAMACGVPCVVTDVGDSAEIVGQFGRVVPPDDSQSLGNAILDVVQGASHSPNAEFAEHIRRNFSLDALIERTEKLLQEHTRDC